MANHFTHRLGREDAGLRLDGLIAKLCADWSRAQIKRSIEAGDVEVDGLVVKKASQRLDVGQTIQWQRPELIDPEAPGPEAIAFGILYEDAHIYVIDKPSGLVVHPGAGHATGTLVNGLLARDAEIAKVGAPDRPGIVHRLDAETSGLMIVAREQSAYERLLEMFSTHAILRQYWAICHAPRLAESGRLDTPYGRHPTQRIKYSSRFEAPKRAITDFELLSRNAQGYALVTCRLETGRTHQVRVHLSDNGAPILGDKLYAPKAIAAHKAVSRLALHAGRLRFEHPVTGETMDFSLKLGDELLGALEKLSLDQSRCP